MLLVLKPPGLEPLSHSSFTAAHISVGHRIQFLAAEGLFKVPFRITGSWWKQRGQAQEVPGKVRDARAGLHSRLFRDACLVPRSGCEDTV